MISKSNQFSIVVQYNDIENQHYIFNTDLIHYCESNSDLLNYWSFIKHDSDFDNNGEVKTIHYHLILVFDKKRQYRKETIINDIARSLNCSRNIISVQVLKDITSSVQYLTHKNNFEKNQYLLTDIISSDNETTALYWNSLVVEQDISIKLIYDICKNADSLLQVFLSLGCKNSRLYFSVIKSIYNEVHSVYKDT